MAQSKVKVKASNGSLQLVFTYQGKRRWWSIGLQDTVIAGAIAKTIAAKIEQDILTGQFVDDVNHYRPEQRPAPDPRKPERGRLPELSELYSAYLDHIRPNRSQTSFATMYRRFLRMAEQAPWGLEESQKLRVWLQGNYSAYTARRCLLSYSACCKWAVESGRLSSNPLDGLVPKAEKKSSGDINPFTAEEKDRVLDAVAGNDSWRYYWRLLAFLFYTGCRPSEAVALEWGHIASDGRSLTFCQAATVDERGQLRVKAGLKTQKRRKIPLNDRVIGIIGRPDGRSDLVFSSPRTDGLIDSANLGQRQWRSVLAATGIGYRSLYQCRHTFITLALQSGMAIADVAKIVGNSPEVILKHYAGVSRVLELPEV
jgi:integrase